MKKLFRDGDWIKKFPYGFFMRLILSENLSTYEISIIPYTVEFVLTGLLDKGLINFTMISYIFN